MVDFFITYYKRTLNRDLRTLMEIILNLAEDSSDQVSWNDWSNAAKKALQNKNNEKFIDKFVEKKLTELQAYNAMVKFLTIYFKKTDSDLMGWLLGSLSFLIDGGTADPAFWYEWNNAIKKILQEQNDKICVDNMLGISLTGLQAFKAMVQFLRIFMNAVQTKELRLFSIIFIFYQMGVVEALL